MCSRAVPCMHLWVTLLSMPSEVADQYPQRKPFRLSCPLKITTCEAPLPRRNPICDHRTMSEDVRCVVIQHNVGHTFYLACCTQHGLPMCQTVDNFASACSRHWSISQYPMHDTIDGWRNGRGPQHRIHPSKIPRLFCDARSVLNSR